MKRTNNEARIGFLWPADGLNDDEFYEFLPNNVAWLTARYDAATDTEELTPEVLAAYAAPETLRRAARMLRAVEPELVACGDFAASFIAGNAGERGMSNAIETELGCRAVTMGAATVEALLALGAQRVALVSPYSAQVSQALSRYLADAGIAVSGWHSFGATHELDIGTRPAHAWCDELLRFTDQLLDRPDALLLAGGGVRFATSITEFESRSGLPVVTAPGALVRASLVRLGLSAVKPGRGKLFRGEEQGCAARISALQSSGTKSFVLSEYPPVFIAGSGPRLVSEQGSSYLDFACGSGTSAVGHGHPAILSALGVQAAGGVLHLGPHFHSPSQAQLYESLAALLPPTLSRFHPAVSGGEATEVAIKAAMHVTGRNQFIGFERGYHGRSMGALAVSGSRGRNAALGPFSPMCDILPFPTDTAGGELAAEHIRALDEKLAGVIIEPIQATGGLHIADKDGLAAIAAAAGELGVPLIFDEAFTGFGRTGRTFAFEHFDLLPDMLILGKALGGGLPAGMVAGGAEWLGRWPAGVQTSTFQMHPASAATAHAFIDLFQRESLSEAASRIGVAIEHLLEPLNRHALVREVRGMGAFWVLEMKSRDTARRVRRGALKRGLLTWECGYGGECIGLVPPLIASQSDLEEAAGILHTALGPERRLAASPR